MVVTRRRGRNATEENKEKKQRKRRNVGFEDKKESGKKGSSSSSSAEAAVAGSDYEAIRSQRMRENMERLKSLGILDLSKKLNNTTNASPKEKQKKKPPTKSPIPNDTPRRSSRLENRTRPSYAECRPFKEEKKVITSTKIHIEEGSKPEVYTEEDEKLLGYSKTSWTLLVDGYDDEGQRIYDSVEGKSCHQCRQKTVGRRTKCSTCNLVNGQFCGDCLYTRYGENLIEVNENPDWICPVCRGICNCSCCRRKKGWAATGAIYRQVQNLGFNSVAHYLIQTHRPKIKAEELANENLVSDDVLLGRKNGKTGGKENDGVIDDECKDQDVDNDNDSADESSE